MNASWSTRSRLKFAFTQPIELRFAELIAGVRPDIAVHLYGSDLDPLRAKAEEIEAVLRDVPGAADVAVLNDIVLLSTFGERRRVGVRRWRRRAPC